ncbi:PREDICTED: uncharacterized protein LOC106727405 [Myotis brandtii]|uniref:uncharacterized protein LOC106727405 n=1 Tax=Myotis brandtii TaxID=109478 RepID=UPI0007045EF3|nr:PREDICTED: uncharacterized protein LOC106727405 [Myotis brandtii]
MALMILLHCSGRKMRLGEGRAFAQSHRAGDGSSPLFITVGGFGRGQDPGWRPSSALRWRGPQLGAGSAPGDISFQSCNYGAAPCRACGPAAWPPVTRAGKCHLAGGLHLLTTVASMPPLVCPPPSQRSLRVSGALCADSMGWPFLELRPRTCSCVSGGQEGSMKMCLPEASSSPQPGWGPAEPEFPPFHSPGHGPLGLQQEA